MVSLAKELGGIIEQFRLTDGVEVAIFLYETDKNEYKVSLRSKEEDRCCKNCYCILAVEDM